MAKSFDDLVKWTTTKKTRVEAARRAKTLLGEIRKLTGKSLRQLAAALGIKQPILSKLEKQGDTPRRPKR
jgi:hypothetical protein